MKILKEINQQLIRLLAHIDKNSKRNLLILLIFSPFIAILEIVAVSSIVPFLGIILEPNKYLNLYPYSEILNRFYIFNTRDLIYFALVIFFLIQLVTGFARLCMIGAITRMSFIIAVDLSTKIYKKYIYQSYISSKLLDTSDATAILTTHVNSIPYHILIPILTTINSIFSLIFLLFVLSYADLFSFSILIVGFLCIFIFIFNFTNKYLKVNSIIITNETSLIIKILRETFIGFRDIIIYNLHLYNISLFEHTNQKLRNAQRINQLILQFPRPAVESLGMLIVGLIIIYIISSDVLLTEAIPILGLFALGAQRALPHLQSIFTSIGTISGSYDSLRNVVCALEKPELQQLFLKVNDSIPTYAGIKLTNVSFTYPNESRPVLKNISLSISKGDNVCIYGTTGCGKSTLIDIFMGLIVPSAGEVSSGDFIITEKSALNWRRLISHVPQSIFLANLSIAENIALGISRDDIDENKLIRCAKIAQIHEQILLINNKYDSVVGENGVLLSGGQRQRIGIARALYRGGEILVLDESTSGLDSETERKVYEALFDSHIYSSIILVTHKLSLLKFFDNSFRIHNGELCKS